MDLAGKKATVIGLGREGLAATRFFAEHGALVTVSDAKSPAALHDALKEVQDLPITLSLGDNRVEDTVGADVVCVSPGIPPDIPALQAARAQGIPVTSPTVLFFALCPAPIVGVTGSSGKSTTTALVGAMLRCGGYQTLVGGNIGVPLLQLLPEINPQSWVVAELSSFQLALLRQSPHVGVITTLSPDHLDWHPDLAHYVDAKKNLLRYQRSEDWAVLNADDPQVLAMASVTPARLLYFGCDEPSKEEGVFLRQGQVIAQMEGWALPLLEAEEIPLRGPHNQANACAAAAAALACDVAPEAIRTAIRSFHGLPHRLELVREVRGVRYYDDSIATTPDRTIAALRSFQEPIILLVGGKGKNLPMDRLGQAFRERCRLVILFGEAGPQLARALCQGSSPNAPDLLLVSNLEEAVQAAAKAARPGDVVLLSPAHTSFDQFRNYQERGEAFQSLVGALEGP